MAIALTEQEISHWLASYVGELLARPASEIDRNTTFDSFGIDSANVIGMTGELQALLGVQIDPEAVYEYSTISSFAGYLAGSANPVPGQGKGSPGLAS